MQRPENAPLHRLQTVGEIWDGAIPNDIAGVIQKPAIHPRAAQLRAFRIKRLVDDCFNGLGDDVLLAVAVLVGRLLRAGFAPSMGNSGWSEPLFFFSELMSGAH